MRRMLFAVFFAFLFASPALAGTPQACIPATPTPSSPVPAACIPRLPGASGPATPLLAAWTQFAAEPKGETAAARLIQARFVMLGDHADCDGVIVEGDGPPSSTVKAALRGQLHGVNPETGEKFTVTVCTASLPESWAKVRLKYSVTGVLTVYPSGNDAILPGPAAMSNRAVLSGIVMADTGCRGKYTGGATRFYQDCQKDWPFPQIIARAANDDPAFVLHGGDYHYYFESEAGFWNQDDGRDRFEYWLQEFLVPAQPLLMKAPWVLARGNHERCQDHRWFGEGWHVLFSNMSLEGKDEPKVRRPCYDPDPSGNDWVAPSWAVDLVSGSSPIAPPWRVVVIDSNQPHEAGSGFKSAKTLTEAHGRDAFWLSHYPPVKMVYYRPTPDFGNGTIKADAAGATDCGAPYACRPRLVFSGHQHLYQEIRWTEPDAPGPLPRVIVVGNGGTKLDGNGLPGFAQGNDANASIICAQKFPDVLPDTTSPFGFGAGRMALLRTASQYGYLHIRRDVNATDALGWIVTPKWIGAAPSFPDFESVHCDGTPVKK